MPVVANAARRPPAKSPSWFCNAAGFCPRGRAAARAGVLLSCSLAVSPVVGGVSVPASGANSECVQGCQASHAVCIQSSKVGIGMELETLLKADSLGGTSLPFRRWLRNDGVH